MQFLLVAAPTAQDVRVVTNIIRSEFTDSFVVTLEQYYQDVANTLSSRWLPETPDKGQRTAEEALHNIFNVIEPMWAMTACLTQVIDKHSIQLSTQNTLYVIGVDNDSLDTGGHSMEVEEYSSEKWSVQGIPTLQAFYYREDAVVDGFEFLADGLATVDLRASSNKLRDNLAAVVHQINKTVNPSETFKDMRALS